MAIYGITNLDAQAVIEMAIGGKTATVKYEAERKFDVRVRYQQEYRKDENDIGNLMVPTMRGGKFRSVRSVRYKDYAGPAFIYRDNTKRFIGVKFSVRERDLGSTIAEAAVKK